MLNRRAFFAIFIGIFTGMYLFQAFLIMDFIGDFVTTLQFMFVVNFTNRLINGAIATVISICIIILIDSNIIFISRQKKD